jgi:hypothetical protein
MKHSLLKKDLIMKFIGKSVIVILASVVLLSTVVNAATAACGGQGQPACAKGQTGSPSNK